MHYDDLYEYTGHMGRFQWIVFAAMFGVTMLSVEIANIIFVGGSMDHWCSIDALSRFPAAKQKEIAIPYEKQDSTDSGIESTYSSCQVYRVNWSMYSYDELENWNRTQWLASNYNNSTTPEIDECTAWNYDHSTFTSSIVERFGLVCDHEYLVEFVTTLIMLGGLAGTLTSGAISDRYGRKISLIIFLLAKAAGTALTLIGSNYATFAVGRMISETGACGVCLTAFVVVMEMVGPKRRTLIGILIQVGYSIGFVMNAFVAYFVRDDFYLQLITMIPSVIFIPYLIIMPESPRWLIVKGRYKEATDILRRMCKSNKTKLPDDFDLSNLNPDAEAAVADRRCSAVLRSRQMLIRSILINYNWFALSLVYVALTLFPHNYQEFSDSLYVNTFISGAVEIPVSIATIFLVDMKFLGRRGTGGWSVLAAGVICFLCAFVIQYDYPLTVMSLSLLGKTFITLSYSVAYLHGTEIFPTEIRNVGLGTASTTEGIGGMIAPIIAGLLKRQWLPLPSIIYGSLSILSCLCYVYLPETLGESLPDTVEEADEMVAKQKKKKPKNAVDAEVTEPENHSLVSPSTVLPSNAVKVTAF